MEIKIALAGNPNCGKTTLFNVLTGSNQFVGNWPGVTVEKKEGKLKKQDGVIITDLPGIYSLSPYTIEEIVARNYLIEERPNAILNIVDATNLERNLYLTTQLLELGIPVVVALNMMDIVRKYGDKINTQEISKRLKCKVVEISALKSDGLDEAIEAVLSVAKKEQKPIPMHIFSGEVEHALAHIEEAIVHNLPDEQQRWYAIKIFERDEKVIAELKIDKELLAHIEKDIAHVEEEFEDTSDSIIINERYNYIERTLNGCYKKKNDGRLTPSEKIDKIVTHRIFALPIFAVIMFIVYFVSVSTVGTIVTDWTNDGLFGDGFNFFGVWVDGIPVIITNALLSINCESWLISLIVDGIVAGVGAVLGFVPQILVLFIFLAFLEACGYMSRIAFVLDKLFRKIGLSGKSFIPMLIGTGCSVPGIMASRTIENERDRRMTIMTTPFMPCGAKLPFIALIAGSVFGGAWWVAPSAYFLGIFAIVLSGLILKKTKPFEGEPAPFVMELPPYHLPTVSTVLHSMWERGWSFIKKAGTVILLSSVVVWFLQSFGVVDGVFKLVEEDEINFSILAYLGKLLAWLFVPLGFGNWQSVVASMTGFVAKENIVSTLSVLYGGATGISSAYTVASGYSFFVFNLLCSPCFAAIGAIKREMNSTKWTLITIGYQTLLAYCVSFVAYNFINLFSGNITNFWGVAGVLISILVIGFAVIMVIRPDKKEKNKG